MSLQNVGSTFAFTPNQAGLVAVNKISLALAIFRFLAVFWELEKNETPC